MNEVQKKRKILGKENMGNNREKICEKRIGTNGILGEIKPEAFSLETTSLTNIP